jgi:hypothetical protein
MKKLVDKRGISVSQLVAGSVLVKPDFDEEEAPRKSSLHKSKDSRKKG